MLSETQNDIIKLWMKDEILYGSYKKNTIMGLEAAKSIVKLRRDFTEGKTVKAIFFISNISLASSSAKKYLAEEGSDGFEKVAFICTNPIIRMLAQIFLKEDKPDVPIKIFSSEKEGLEWLKSKALVKHA